MECFIDLIRRKYQLLIPGELSLDSALWNLPYYDVSAALDYLVKGDLIKIDLTRILLDHKETPELTSEEYITHYRYQIEDALFNVPAKLHKRR
jgi:hypothetical protein